MKKNDVFHTEELGKRKTNKLLGGLKHAQTDAKLLPRHTSLSLEDIYKFQDPVNIYYYFLKLFYYSIKHYVIFVMNRSKKVTVVLILELAYQLIHAIILKKK